MQNGTISTTTVRRSRPHPSFVSGVIVGLLAAILIALAAAALIEALGRGGEPTVATLPAPPPAQTQNPDVLRPTSIDLEDQLAKAAHQRR